MWLLTWLGLNLVTCYWYLSNLFLLHFSALFWINWIFCYSILLVHLAITLFCYFSDCFGFYSIHHYVIPIFLEVIYHFTYVLYQFIYVFIIYFMLSIIKKNLNREKRAEHLFQCSSLLSFFFFLLFNIFIIKLITNYFTFLISEKNLPSF